MKKYSLFVGCVVAVGLLAGCGSSISPKKLAGSWMCKETNPDGSFNTASWIFSADGRYEISSMNNGMPLNIGGAYKVDGKKVELTMTTMSFGGRSRTDNSSKVETVLAIQDLKEDGFLSFESTVLKSGNKRPVNCRKS